MVDLFARIVAIFDTPAGMTVLGMAALAFAALFVIVFWDSIKAPRRDIIQGGAEETAPPPLLSPDIVTRGRLDTGPVGPLWVRNALLMGLGAFFVFAGLGAIGHIGEQASQQATIRASLAPTDPVQTTGAPLREVQLGTPDQIDVCEPAGSLADRFVEICAEGASVRFDLLRFSQADTFVLRPSWASNDAPTFVASDSHAAPFSFDSGVSFSAPETIEAPVYDGFLVIGIAEGELGIAVERERALRDFAIAQLSGGDRAECATSERVYSVSAAFDRSAIEELATLRKTVTAERKVAQDNHQVRGELAALEEQLAARELTVIDRPGPIVLGITADPNASDAVQDMLAASRAFVAQHAEELQITDIGAVDNLRACARGEVAL